MSDPTVANSTTGPLIACHRLGNLGQTECCYASSNNSSICNYIASYVFNSTDQGGCPTGNCFKDCNNLTQIYSSLQQDLVISGNGAGPRRRFQACLNVPYVARAQSAGLLSPDFTQRAQDQIPRDNREKGLRDATAAVTDCLSSTCRNARGRKECYDNYCAPTKLLINNTTPSADCLGPILLVARL